MDLTKPTKFSQGWYVVQRQRRQPRWHYYTTNGRAACNPAYGPSAIGQFSPDVKIAGCVTCQNFYNHRLPLLDGWADEEDWGSWI